MLAVLIGALQNILSKGSKYSLFDPCKEMAYIPLGESLCDAFIISTALTLFYLQTPSPRPRARLPWT